MNRTNVGLRLVLGDIRARGPKSLADSLADALRFAVRDGRLPAGTSLPASRSLATDLEVSRGVVVRAYEQLVAEGYLRAHTGRGTIVGDVHAPETATPPSLDRAMPASPGLPALGWFPRREWLRAMESAMADQALREFEIQMGMVTPETAGVEESTKQLGPSVQQVEQK